LADDRRTGRPMDLLRRGYDAGAQTSFASATRSCRGLVKRWNRLAVRTSKEHDKAAAEGAFHWPDDGALLTVDGHSRDHRGRALAGQSGLGILGLLLALASPSRGALTRELGLGRAQPSGGQGRTTAAAGERTRFWGTRRRRARARCRARSVSVGLELGRPRTRVDEARLLLPAVPK
jgi:hypothetical protein